MRQAHIELQIGEIVVDSRLRMTRARLEQAITEQLHDMLEAAGPEGLVQDSNGEIHIESLTIRASNALTPVRIGEQIAEQLASPLAEPGHLMRGSAAKSPSAKSPSTKSPTENRGI